MVVFGHCPLRLTLSSLALGASITCSFSYISWYIGVSIDVSVEISSVPSVSSASTGMPYNGVSYVRGGVSTILFTCCPISHCGGYSYWGGFSEGKYPLFLLGPWPLSQYISCHVDDVDLFPVYGLTVLNKSSCCTCNWGKTRPGVSLRTKFMVLTCLGNGPILTLSRAWGVHLKWYFLDCGLLFSLYNVHPKVWLLLIFGETQPLRTSNMYRCRIICLEVCFWSHCSAAACKATD